jgi:hypothetical protein
MIGIVTIIGCVIGLCSFTESKLLPYLRRRYGFFTQTNNYNIRNYITLHRLQRESEGRLELDEISLVPNPEQTQSI